MENEITTPEQVVYATPVPEWAAGTECILTDRSDCEMWELRRDGRPIGWMYDDGNGYEFDEWERGDPEEVETGPNR